MRLFLFCSQLVAMLFLYKPLFIVTTFYFDHAPSNFTLIEDIYLLICLYFILYMYLNFQSSDVTS